MKKIIVAATIAVSSIALVACSSQDAPTPTVTVTETAPAIPDPAPIPDSTDDGTTSSSSSEELYLIGIKSMDNPILNVATDAQLLEMGYAVCEALDAGFTVDDIIQYMARQMFSEGMTSDAEVDAVGYIIGAADIALCPSATF